MIPSEGEQWGRYNLPRWIDKCDKPMKKTRKGQKCLDMRSYHPTQSGCCMPTSLFLFILNIGLNSNFCWPNPILGGCLWLNFPFSLVGSCMVDAVNSVLWLLVIFGQAALVWQWHSLAMWKLMKNWVHLMILWIILATIVMYPIYMATELVLTLFQGGDSQVCNHPEVDRICFL
jgi:hypothetical protein